MLAAGRITALLPGLLLFLLAAGVYLPTLGHGFISFDDPMYVTHNPMVRGGLTDHGAAWAFSLHARPYWHPLVWLSLMLDASLYGMRAWGFHLTNLLLHAGSVALFFAFLRRATGAVWAPALAAALLALHPLHVESVAWVTERKDVLAQFLGMAALLAYVRYAERPSPGRYGAVAGCLALGLAAKPMLVTLPCVLLLLDYWPLGRTPWLAPARCAGSGQAPGSGLPPARSPGRLLVEKLPLLALSGLSMALTLLSHEASRTAGEIPLSLGLANALVSYPDYLLKLLWPSGLTFFYPFPDAVPAWKIAGAVLTLAGGFVLAWGSARTRPFLTVGWLWFAGTLAPALKITPHGLWYAIADRFLYFPAPGLYLAAAFGLRGLALARPALARPLAGGALAALAVLSALTLRQQAFWKDSEALYRRALTVTTRNHVAHNNLGDWYETQGRDQEALAEYGKALEIRPDHVNALLNVAKFHLKRERPDQAAVFLDQALARDGRSPAALDLLAVLRLTQGRPAEAVQAWTTAAQGDPANAQIQANLGLALLSTGQRDRAEAQFRKALALDPRLKTALEGLKLTGRTP